MKSFSVVCLMMVAGASYAQSQPSSAFLGEDENAPKVQAFYQEQCSKLASGQGVSNGSSSYNTYMSQCLKDMKAVWPIGYDDAE